MICNIIFDCFGTLIDAGSGSVEATGQILKNVKSEENPQVFYKKWKTLKKDMMIGDKFYSEKELFAISLNKMFEEYNIKADALKEVQPMIRVLFSERKVFKETKETLKMLDEKGIRYAIGSTTDTDSIEYFLKQNELNIENVFTSEDMRVYKPFPRFYEEILKSTGWDVDECLFVGDNLIDDIKGPQSIGMKAVLIDRKSTYDINSGIKPDYIISSLNELENII
ncbi:MAG: HAD family hydrolase [Lachnospiraceae bacterium]|nr:HAD family hydrolase [Lachnospiraceae bacterium]